MLILPNLLPLFCHVDDFCQSFEPAQKAHQIADGKPRRNRARSLCTSEVITLLIAFHQSGFRTFKTFYTRYVCPYLKTAFPGLVSCHRFIEFIPAALVALFAYLGSLFGRCTSIAFVDSTPLCMCENPRINQHKVFAATAKRGKTSTGWFFGFKLHLVISDTGELLTLTLIPGNTDDRKPVLALLHGTMGKMFGKLIGDKGYISRALTEALAQGGVELITKVRKNMKPRALSDLSEWDKFLLRKRAVIESVIDQLKNISQVEHTRHRAATGFLWNVAASLIAYCHQPKKPSLNLNFGTRINLA